jgi:heptosyltransferase-2
MLPVSEGKPIEKPIHRILIIKFGGMGEAIHARSLVEHLRHRNPGMTFDFLVEERTLEAMTCGSQDNALVYHPRSDGVWRAVAILKEIRSRRYDAIVDFEPRSTLTASFAWATSIPIRIGFVSPEPGPRIRFFTHSLPLREEESVWSCFLQIGRLLDPTLPQALQTVSLPISSEARLWCDQWWSSNFGDHTGPVVALHLGVGPSAQYRRWPVECFTELATILLQKNVAVLLTGAKGEQALISSFKNSFYGKSVEASDLGTLEYTAALLQRCDLLVSNDTGVMHLGAAMGTPTVGLFGASNPVPWAPVGPRSTYLYKTRQPCSPCINFYRRQIPQSCTASVESACMRDISVEDVLEASRTVIQGDWLA